MSELKACPHTERPSDTPSLVSLQGRDSWRVSLLDSE